MRSIFSVAVLFVTLAASAAPLDESAINALIAKMTLQEKVSLVSGDDPQTHAIKRLGIPALIVNDGPLGVRKGHSTAFPSGIALGASFDPDLAEQMGSAIGEEALSKGINVMLGPCVNIAREPFGGRNFESYGEDPLLNSVLAASYIRGMQSKNVIATVKHFMANDQEFHRMTSSSDLDIRTMFEIHLPMFKAAVDAGVWSVMSSYNRINGVYASEDPDLLTHILKEKWGFKGYVVSDWTAVHSTVPTANAGLDLEMPTGLYFGAKLAKAVESGKVKIAVLDDKVRRILRAMNAMGILSTTAASREAMAKASPGPETIAHQNIAQKIAEEGIVLLKNSGILPLKGTAASITSIAAIGPHAAILRTGGGGSSKVIPFHAVSPVEALRAEFGPQIAVNYAEGVTIDGDLGEPLTVANFKNGLKAEYFRTLALAGKPFLTRKENALDLSSDEKLDDRYGVRLSGQLVAPVTGNYVFSAMNSHVTRVFISGKRVLNVPVSSDADVYQVGVELKAGQAVPFVLETGRGDDDTETHLQFGWKIPEPNPLDHAVQVAKSSDVAILFLGMGNEMEGEGVDRETLALPENQLKLLNLVTAANPNTIVVLSGGGVVTMPWLSKVKAVVQAWYPGQEGGTALARILSGAVNPSGKLPVSFIKDWKDSSAYGFYPGVNDHTRYGEGIFVGYRFLDRSSHSPEFPFGFGLSYTTFKFSALQVTAVNASARSPQVSVKFDVTNTGAVAGDEVAQVYIGEDHPTVDRPARELKSFVRVHLNPGETKTVSLKLDRAAFAFFDVPSMDWKANAGTFTVSVGSSSRDLSQAAGVSLR